MKAASVVWMRLLAAFTCATGLWILATPSRPVTAQGGITITSPAQDAVLRAGPDYAQDVIGDSWDFRQPTDIAPDPAQNAGWSSGPTIQWDGGVVTGTTAVTSNVQIGLLMRPYSGIINPGRNGRSVPIDTAKYSKLAIQFRGTSVGQLPRIFWWHTELGEPGDAAGSRLLPDNPPTAPPAFTTSIYVLDLKQFSSGPAWTSAAFVKGLAYYPNHFPAANDVSVNWVRLTAGDDRPEAAMTTITWTGGSGAVDVTVTNQLSGVAYKIATVDASVGSVTWNYGVLPPGGYVVQVGAATRNFRINFPPSVQITEPDETGGEDFATAVLGNPWDMQDASDFVVNANINDHLTSRQPGPQGFTGVSDTSGDPQVYLLSKQTPQAGPLIDQNQYHRLTYNLGIERSFSLGAGGVTRLLWGSASSASGGGTPYDVTTSKDIIAWPTVSSYTIDLAALTVADGGLEPANATPWTAQPIRHLRIDPFEYPEAVTFHLAAVKLAADDATVGGRFTIKFSAFDAETTQPHLTVALYYDTDRNPDNGMTPIVSGLPGTKNQYLWTPGTSVPAGLYYIYCTADDGVNTTRRYSTGPVRVIPAALPAHAAGDFDGDSLRDVAVYKANGDWAILTSKSGYVSSIVRGWGGDGYTPVPGDYDGDGRQEIAVYREDTGAWSILTSSTGYAGVLGVNWGGPGYKAMPGDYDGDGRTDIAVYRRSTGVWSILTSSSGYASAIGVSYGGPGYLPIGGQDFDGDGKADVAVYETATGRWIVLKSSANFTDGFSATLAGRAGDSLVPGDYDGDGKADFAVFRDGQVNFTALWVTLTSSSGYTATVTREYAGGGLLFVPVPGDYDGDGICDLAGFQRGIGNWDFAFSSTGFTQHYSVSDWGNGTDAPISSAIPIGSNDLAHVHDIEYDLRTEMTVYQASTGLWHWLRSQGGYTSAENRSWGGAGYTPVPGDYDNDGRVDFAVYQESSGNWYLLLSRSGYTSGLSKNVGGPGWIPVPADYDGDGRMDLVVYNVTSGLWYGLESGTEYTTSLSISWGGTGYTAAPGDFDGDGRADLAVYQPSSGYWYVLLADAGYTTTIAINAGGADYVPVQADYDGDARTDFAVYNPTTGLWYALKSGGNYTTTLAISWGGPGYTPVRGDFDGDGRQDLAVYQGSSGNWYILLSGANYTTSLSRNWGGSGYSPVPGFP